MGKEKERMLRALREYISDMEGVASVSPCHLGLWVTMANGARLHVQVSQMKEAK